jgi:hypothetical protein
MCPAAEAAAEAVEEVPLVDHKPPHQNSGKSGQAMIEFLLGLVGIMFLLVGLLQARELSWHSSQMNLDVRGELAEQMLGQNAVPSSGEMVYSEGHDKGEDGLLYTDDDLMLSASPFDFVNAFLEYVGYSGASSMGGSTTKDYLENYGVQDPYQALDETSANISDTFDMLYQDSHVEVMVLPFMQNLIGKSTIDLQEGIWMPHLGDLMEE